MGGVLGGIPKKNNEYIHLRYPPKKIVVVWAFATRERGGRVRPDFVLQSLELPPHQLRPGAGGIHSLLVGEGKWTNPPLGPSDVQWGDVQTVSTSAGAIPNLHQVPPPPRSLVRDI